MNRVGRLGMRTESGYWFFVEKNFALLTDAILLVDDAKAKAGIAPIHFGRHLSDGGSASLDDALPPGSRSEAASG